MAYEQKDNQGGLFINHEKSGNPHRPDYTGSMTMNGEKFRLAGWLKKSKSKNEDWISLKIERFHQPEEQEPPKAAVHGFPKPH